MKVLLAGNTGYVTEEFVEEAFPECQVMVLGNKMIKTVRRRELISRPFPRTELELGDIFRTYEFEAVVYFSNYLTLHGELEGEAENLRKILQYCRKGVQSHFLYVTGPEGMFDVPTGKTLLVQNAEDVCRRYAGLYGLKVKILRVPYLYSGIYKKDFFYRIFQASKESQKLFFREAPEQKACFLYSMDLAELMYKLFDNWNDEEEVLNVPDVFDICFQDVTEELKKVLSPVSIIYKSSAVVEKIKEDKFEILDEIKEIKTLDKIQTTLSIAISEDGENNLEKYKSAKAVIDIALGRGGDQAIIKQNGKYFFFGGRTQEVEKRTKVKARIVSQAMQELMQAAQNIIIMGHTNSDIDAMGSGLGVYSIAKHLGKEAYLVNETTGTSLDTFITELKEDEEYKNILINKAEALNLITPETLLVVVDTDKRNYVEVPELLEKTDKIAVIDHHRRGTDYIENAILTFHEVYASSACELVTELIEYAEDDIKLKTMEVEALYAGIMMDTKNFTFKTGVRTFEAAAYLRKCGVDIIKVKKWFQSDLDTYNKISEIVAKSEIIDGNIAISVYDKEDSDANITCAKAADELLTISNITASFVIGKMGEQICISGRSIGDINVQLILEKLGGGGHITVAGAQLEGMTQEEVKQELINRINEYFTEVS